MKVAGAYLTTDGSGAGWTQTADTAQCKHCQRHWVIQPGSGIARGFCMSCMGPTCGAPRCETRCVPFEKVMEQEEAAARVSREFDSILAGLAAERG